MLTANPIKTPHVRYTLQPPQNGYTYAHVTFQPRQFHGFGDMFFLSMANDQDVVEKTYAYYLKGSQMVSLDYFQDKHEAVHQTIIDRYFKDHIVPQMPMVEDTIQFPVTNQ